MNGLTDIKSWSRLLMCLTICSAIWLGAAGCEGDDDEFKDHDPPPGRGALGVDNRTFEDLDVFANGVLLAHVSDGKEAIIDLLPREYRIVLDSDDGHGGWFGEIDVVEGRVAVLRVEQSSYDHDLNVDLEYE